MKQVALAGLAAGEGLGLGVAESLFRSGFQGVCGPGDRLKAGNNPGANFLLEPPVFTAAGRSSPLCRRAAGSCLGNR